MRNSKRANCAYTKQKEGNNKEENLIKWKQIIEIRLFKISQLVIGIDKLPAILTIQ